jgi:hypothetical protein
MSGIAASPVPPGERHKYHVPGMTSEWERSNVRVCAASRRPDRLRSVHLDVRHPSFSPRGRRDAAPPAPPVGNHNLGRSTLRHATTIVRGVLGGFGSQPEVARPMAMAS